MAALHHSPFGFTGMDGWDIFGGRNVHAQLGDGTLRLSVARGADVTLLGLYKRFWATASIRKEYFPAIAFEARFRIEGAGEPAHLIEPSDQPMLTLNASQFGASLSSSRGGWTVSKGRREFAFEDYARYAHVLICWRIPRGAGFSVVFDNIDILDG